LSCVFSCLHWSKRIKRSVSDGEHGSTHSTRKKINAVVLLVRVGVVYSVCAMVGDCAFEQYSSMNHIGRSKPVGNETSAQSSAPISRARAAAGMTRLFGPVCVFGRSNQLIVLLCVDWNKENNDRRENKHRSA
jgi:hypothetical protein